MGKAALRFVERITKALRERRELSFSYEGLREDSPRTRRVRPLHLTLTNGQWYLLGEDVSLGEIRTFSLARMTRVLVTKKTFSENSAPDVDQSIAPVFGVPFGDTKATEVRLRFEAEVAKPVTEREWHASQRVKRLGDGRVELFLRVRLTRQFANWIRSWGENVEVLEPKELRNEIAESARKMLARYA